jgi:hypothetical protein
MSQDQTKRAHKSFEYVVTAEDPTVWTRTWIVKQEFTKQSDEENRILLYPDSLKTREKFLALFG